MIIYLFISLLLCRLALSSAFTLIRLSIITCMFFCGWVNHVKSTKLSIILGGRFLYIASYGVTPVSYTHLDVYKRQLYIIVSWLFKLFLCRYLLLFFMFISLKTFTGQLHQSNLKTFLIWKQFFVCLLIRYRFYVY